jgi:TPP-dependent pyruvate/acetoin dehydrogenase alpha subunit
MGDPERYRKHDEVKKWEESDPIGIFRKKLESQNIPDSQLDEIDARVENEISKAVEFAEASPEPGMDELYKDIYADVD